MEMCHGNFSTKIVRKSPDYQPFTYKCEHECEYLIQFIVDDGFVMLELCVMEAERIAGCMMDVIDEAYKMEWKRG